jgi:hypothetical protein
MLLYSFLSNFVKGTQWMKLGRQDFLLYVQICKCPLQELQLLVSEKISKEEESVIRTLVVKVWFNNSGSKRLQKDLQRQQMSLQIQNYFIREGK